MAGHFGHRPMDFDQEHGKALKMQREAALPTCPGHLESLDMPVAIGEFGHAAVQVAGVLEEIEVLPGALLVIMKRGGLAVGIEGSKAFFKLDVDMDGRDAFVIVFLRDVGDVIGRL